MNDPMRGPDAPPDDDIAARPPGGNPLLWIIVIFAVLAIGFYVYNVTGGSRSAMPITPASQPAGSTIAPSTEPATPATPPRRP